MKDCVIAIVLIAFILFSTTTNFYGYGELHAAEKKKAVAAIYLFPDSFSAEKARDAQKMVAENVAALKNYDYADAEARMLAAGYSKSKESIQEALKLFRTGKELYDNLEVEKAIKNFESAKELFEKQLDKTADFEFFSKILLYLGAAHTMIDEKGKARSFFVTFLNIRPGFALDEAEFPPNILDAFNKVKEDIEMMPNGSIFFKSYPENALVFFDGRIAGVTPLRLDGITAGFHYYRIHKAGYDDIAGIIEIGDKEESEIDKNLFLRVGAEFLPDAEKEYASSLGSSDMILKSLKNVAKLGVDQIVFFHFSVEPRKNSLTLKAVLVDKDKKSYKISEKEFVFTEENSNVSPNAIKSFIDKIFSQEMPFTLLTAASTVDGKSSEIMSEEEPSKKEAVISDPIYTKWWFWVAVGACAAGAGVGTYMLTKDGDEKKSDNNAILKINFK